MNAFEGPTVIGKDVVLRGELSSNEDLFLNGTFEGTIHLPNARLTVGPEARVTAEVHLRDLILLGKIDGNVTATGRIELRETAVLNGNVVASRLSIDESATIRGRVELTGHGAGKALNQPAEAV